MVAAHSGFTPGKRGNAQTAHAITPQLRGYGFARVQFLMTLSDKIFNRCKRRHAVMRDALLPQACGFVTSTQRIQLIGRMAFSHDGGQNRGTREPFGKGARARW